jgi:hypothetical protein
MKPRNTAFLLMPICMSALTAFAEPITFVLDETNSFLTISGTFSGFAIAPQGPGSTNARYSGTIEADVTSSNITFVGGSMIQGLDSGSWQPLTGGAAGSAPANYGGQVVNILVNGKAAIRNMLLDATSDPLVLSSTNFPSDGLRFNFPPGAASVIDYNYAITLGSSGMGTQPLTGNFTNSIATNATLVAQGAQFTVTIPVDISSTATVTNPDDLQYRLVGRIVARSASAAVPLQITSFQLSSGQLQFTISTTPGKSYSILGSTNLMDWGTVHQFTATNTPSTTTVPLPPIFVPEQFFRVRQD